MTMKARQDGCPFQWSHQSSTKTYKQTNGMSHVAYLYATIVLTYCTRLKDPYIGFNELDARWVDEKSWIYRREFEMPVIAEECSTVLVFDGLDTFARVRLNGTVILNSNNMFLAHRIDITDALQLSPSQKHVLEIEFDSAMLRGKELEKLYPEHKWGAFNGDPSRLGVRKAQYHWGWDWGPILMTAGIWREVRLEVYHARIRDLHVRTNLLLFDAATVTVYADIDSPATYTNASHVEFTLHLNGQEISKREASIVTTEDAKATFHLDQPSLWWPRGYGDQTLYEISVSLMDGEKICELHRVSKRFGIRKAEVIQQNDKHGKSFFFRINGMDIFCGGSCWIPADCLLPSITPERYRRWVELMASGNQVMVRYVP